ncbi:hypothetical protein WAF17_00475 [Bernardetia sp. ABR2-2B]|uniref:hypothetical protein n=1 Tax=Bernardetia sp. ABR2-2B TaxID=3127472 RepID=UPI0030D0DE67
MGFEKCDNCGSTGSYDLGELKTNNGILSSPTYVSEKAKGIRVFGIKKGEYNTKAILCLGCGKIHLFAKGNWQSLI